MGHHSTRVVLCEWEVVDSLPMVCSALGLTLDFRAQRGGALERGQRLGLELLQRYVERIKGSLGSEFK